MNAYKIKYENGDYRIVLAANSLEVIKKYDLATREHVNTRVIQLEGEQKAIALSEVQDRLAYLRTQIEGECISYSEIAELQELADYIPRDDVLLLELAGVPEFSEDDTN